MQKAKAKSNKRDVGRKAEINHTLHMLVWKVRAKGRDYMYKQLHVAARLEPTMYYHNLPTTHECDLTD